MDKPTFEDWQKVNPEKDIYQYYFEFSEAKNEKEESEYSKYFIDNHQPEDKNSPSFIAQRGAWKEWLNKNPDKKIEDYYILIYKNSVQKVEQQPDEIEHGKIKIPPFSNEFMCLNCGHLDIGTYCSICGKEIKIYVDDIEEALIKRLKSCGYITINNWKDSFEIWQSPSLYYKYAFDEYLGHHATVLCKINESTNGNRVELIIISNANKTTFEQIKKTIEKQYLEIKQNIDEINEINTKKRSTEALDYLEHLKVRSILIGTQNSNKTKMNKVKWSIVTKTGILGFSLLNQFNFSGTSIASKFNLSITWDQIFVSNDTFRIQSAVNQPYDLVKHQVEIITKQVKENTTTLTKAQNQNVIIGTAYSIVEEFIEYFKILYQYIKNPHYYSELVTSTKFIPASKVIKLYLIGLVCSIAIPSLLTGGYLNAGNLTLFSGLPPFVSDVAELSFEIVILSIVAGCIHLIARIRGRKGNYGSMLLGMIFMKAFLQLFERPYNYLTGVPLLNLLHGNVEVYTKIVDKYLAVLVYLIIAYFLYPLSHSVYKASRRVTYAGWAVGYIFIIAIGSFSAGDFLLSPTFQSKQRYQSLLHQEKGAIEVYKNEVIPFIEIGDKTGDYSRALEGLDKCEHLFEPLTQKCAEISKETKKWYPENKHLLEYGNAQCEYFEARLQFFFTLEDYLNGKAESEVMQEASHTFQEKMEHFNQISQ
jgi:hypothetical protein